MGVQVPPSTQNLECISPGSGPAEGMAGRRIDVTVARRVRRTGGETYRLWIAELPPTEIDHHEGIPLTTPRRSIIDASRTGTDPRLIAQAIRTAERHDHISRSDADALSAQTRWSA